MMAHRLQHRVLFVSFICISALFFYLRCLQAESIPVRVVKAGAPGQQFDIKAIDFRQISARLIDQRLDKNNSTPSNFTGPELLRPLLGQCFVREDSKYVFRVCPFANVTQHEKSMYAFNFFTTSFHAILGVWREWHVTNNSFDSLLYLNGDACEPGLKRKARVRLQCSNDWTMTDLAYITNVTEIEKCYYQIELASSLFCQLGSVYSRMDPEGQMEWNILETYFQKGNITPEGYDRYLQMILNIYGLGSSEWRNEGILRPKTQKINEQGELDLCKKKVQELEKENMQLKLRLQFKENV